MQIRNNTNQIVCIGDLNVSLNGQSTETVNTLLALQSAELQSLIDDGVIAVVTISSPGSTQFDSFVGSESSDGTLTTTQVTDLTDGGSSTLHFHSTDRARANHTGTQLKATISDFAHGSSSHSGAIGTLSQISDVTRTVADLNSFLPSAGNTAGRPASPSAGREYFDTTLGKPIWYNGTAWVDATGSAV